MEVEEGTELRAVVLRFELASVTRRLVNHRSLDPFPEFPIPSLWAGA